MTDKQFAMEAIMQDIYLSIPISDMEFFQQFIKKMGWKMLTREEKLNQYIASRPQNVPLSDEDILKELHSVRYHQ